MLDIKDIVLCFHTASSIGYSIGEFDLGQGSNTGFDHMAEAIIRNDSFQLFAKHFPLVSWAKQ